MPSSMLLLLAKFIRSVTFTHCQLQAAGSAVCQGRIHWSDGYLAFTTPRRHSILLGPLLTLWGWPIYTVSVVPLSSSFWVNFPGGSTSRRSGGWEEWDHCTFCPSSLPARLAQAGCFHLANMTLGWSLPNRSLSGTGDCLLAFAPSAQEYNAIHCCINLVHNLLRPSIKPSSNYPILVWLFFPVQMLIKQLEAKTTQTPKD